MVVLFDTHKVLLCPSLCDVEEPVVLGEGGLEEQEGEAGRAHHDWCLPWEPYQCM